MPCCSHISRRARGPQSALVIGSWWLAAGSSLLLFFSSSFLSSTGSPASFRHRSRCSCTKATCSADREEEEASWERRSAAERKSCTLQACCACRYKGSVCTAARAFCCGDEETGAATVRKGGAVLAEAAGSAADDEWEQPASRGNPASSRKGIQRSCERIGQRTTITHRAFHEAAQVNTNRLSTILQTQTARRNNTQSRRQCTNSTNVYGKRSASGQRRLRGLSRYRNSRRRVQQIEE